MDIKVLEYHVSFTGRYMGSSDDDNSYVSVIHKEQNIESITESIENELSGMVEGSTAEVEAIGTVDAEYWLRHTHSVGVCGETADGRKDGLPISNPIRLMATQLIAKFENVAGEVKEVKDDELH